MSGPNKGPRVHTGENFQIFESVENSSLFDEFVCKWALFWHVKRVF
jgi:hypothetical protein